MRDETKPNPSPQRCRCGRRLAVIAAVWVGVGLLINSVFVVTRAITKETWDWPEYQRREHPSLKLLGRSFQVSRLGMTRFEYYYERFERELFGVTEERFKELLAAEGVTATVEPPDIIVEYLKQISKPDRTGASAHRVTFGFPFRAASYLKVWDGYDSDHHGYIVGGARLTPPPIESPNTCGWGGNDDPPERIIPLILIPLGLLANTVILGAPFGFPMLLTRAVRAWRRARKGRCMKCAYDLSGVSGEVCPECGLNRFGG